MQLSASKLSPVARGTAPGRRAPLRLLVGLGLLAGALFISAPGSAANEPTAQEVAAPDAPSRGASNVSPEVAQKAAAIARQTMSPFCPGRTLSDCPSDYATAWRRDIRAMVAQGMSASEIQAELERRAGGNLSGSPNRNVSYFVPVLLSVASALLLWFVLARLRGSMGPSERSAARREANKPSADQDATKQGNAAAEQQASRSRALPEIDDARLEQELEALHED